MRAAVTNGPERDEAVLHALHPPAGDGSLPPLVEERHDLPLEELEERTGLHLVPPFEVVEVLGRGDRPPVLAVEALVPPAIEDRQVERRR